MESEFVAGSNYIRKDWQHIEVFEAAMGIKRTEENGMVYLSCSNWEWTCMELDKAGREYARLGHLRRVKKEIAARAESQHHDGKENAYV